MRVAIRGKKSSQQGLRQGLRIHKSLPVKEEFARSDYLNLVRDLFPKVDPAKDKKSVYYRKIEVSPIKDERGYKVSTSVPKSVSDLMTRIKNRFNIPKSCEVIFNFCYVMRLSKSIVKPPSTRTAARFIINYNNHDMVHYTRADDSKRSNLGRELIDVGEISQGMFMKKDTLALLGPCDMCYFNINTKPGSRIYIVDQQGKNRTTIKPTSYARLTVLMDIQINLEYARQMIEDTEKMKSGKIATLTKKVVENMVSELMRREKKKYKDVMEQIKDL